MIVQSISLMRYTNRPLASIARCRGPAPGFDLGKCRVVRRERALGGIETVDQDFVEAEIRDVGKAIGRIHVDVVRVRLLLAVGIDARSRVLHERRGCLQPAVAIHRQDFDAATPVVRHQHGAAGAIDRQVRRSAAAGRLLVQQRQLSALMIDGKGAHRPAGLALEMVNLVDGIEEIALRSRGEEAGAGRLGGQLGRAQHPGLQIQPRDVDALAGGTGVGTDIHQGAGRGA